MQSTPEELLLIVDRNFPAKDLLNISEKLIHNFLETNNTKSIEKVEEENITNLNNFFQGKDAINFLDLVECCCQWIQIGKNESSIMSKFLIFLHVEIRGLM